MFLLLQFFQCFAVHFLISCTAVLSAKVSLPRVHFCLADRIVEHYVLRNMAGTEAQDLLCISIGQSSFPYVTSCRNCSYHGTPFFALFRNNSCVIALFHSSDLVRLQRKGCCRVLLILNSYQSFRHIQLCLHIFNY